MTESCQGRWWVTLVVLSLLGLVVLFDETMILPAIPDFIREFGISYSDSSWLLSIYIIAAAVMTPIAGKMSDIYGKKRVLLTVMGIYIVGVLMGRFAHDFEIMLVARALQGVGMAMFPVAFGIIRESLPQDKATIGQTIFGAMFPAGAIVGLVGGATIIQYFGWQATFLAILPVSLALWLMIFKTVKSSGPAPAEGRKREPIDFAGIATLAATIVLFLTGVTMLEGSDDAYTVAGLFAAAAVSLVAFVAVERRATSPILDFSLMRSASFLPPTLILLFTFLSMFMVYLTVPVMVRSPEPFGFGGDAVDVAGVQLPFMAVFLIGTVMSGFILRKVRNTRLLAIGTVISTAGSLLLLMSHSTPEAVSLGLTVTSVGLSLCMTGGFNIILFSVPPQKVGVALGMTMLLNLIGMSVGPALAGILQETNTAQLEGIDGIFPTQEAYALIFSVAAAISAVSVVMALVVNRSRALPPVPASKGRFAGH